MTTPALTPSLTPEIDSYVLVVDKKTKTSKGKIVKSKRVSKLNEPSKYQVRGIGLKPARVNWVLNHVSINKNEFIAQNALHDAKPGFTKMPKPTKKNPEPETTLIEKKGVPIKKIDNKTLHTLLSRVHEHIKHHNRELYEEQYISANYKDQKLSTYLTKLREAKDQAKSSDQTFNLKKFNESFDKKFYDGLKDFNKKLEENKVVAAFTSYKFKNSPNFETDYTAYKAAKEKSLQAAKEDLYKFNLSYDPNFFNETPTNKSYEDFKREYENNEWARELSVINKLAVRISRKTRYLLSAFLDKVLLEVAEYSLSQCVASEVKTVQIKHLLNYENDLEVYTKFPMLKLVSIQTDFLHAKNYVLLCEKINKAAADKRKELKKEGNKTQKVAATQIEFNKYQEVDTLFNTSFGIYVMDICRHVRNQTGTTCKFSKEFINLCSFIIYELIVNFGESLVVNHELKTVSESQVKQSIESLMKLMGIKNSEMYMTYIDEHVKTYLEYETTKKKEKKVKVKVLLEEESDNESSESSESENEQSEDSESEE